MHALDVESLDYLVLTHPHADHTGNARAVLSYFPVKQGPTDVLSFECDGLDDDFDGGAAYDDAGVPDDEPFMLGDIIIASDYARAQTAQFGTTPQEELAVLLVHGLLHLCGWDHVHSDEEAEAMEAREREMLAGVGLPNIR